MIFNHDSFYSSSFFNTSNIIIGKINQISSSTIKYFNLQQINNQLLRENAMLRQQLAERSKTVLNPAPYQGRFSVIPAEVINKSHQKTSNYITLNVGKNNKVNTGMGILSNKGIVGNIITVSDKFAIVRSIIHQSANISAEIKRTNDLCAVQWETNDYQRVNVKYLPNHIKINIGDTVITSGFNAVYPSEIPIAIVESVELDHTSLYLKISAQLVTDFSTLSYVYVITDEEQPVLDSLNALEIE